MYIVETNVTLHFESKSSWLTKWQFFFNWMADNSNTLDESSVQLSVLLSITTGKIFSLVFYKHCPNFNLTLHNLQ